MDLVWLHVGKQSAAADDRTSWQNWQLHYSLRIAPCLTVRIQINVYFIARLYLL
jgi:hypothetical protein